MSTQSQLSPGASRRIRAEAASWVTRLHGPDRNAEVELGLKRWLAEDAAHAAAFEKATEVWQETGGLPGNLPRRVGWLASQDRGPNGVRLALAAGLVCLVATAAILYLRDPALTTNTGEQRSVTLEDGTRIELNTASRLRVRYSAQSRTVLLDSGEAFFDVAKHASRPFIVLAGPHKVVVLGTTFVVRRDDAAVSVTLVEGQVAVAPAATISDPRKTSAADYKVLKPGQRLRFGAASQPTIDSPSIEKVTAWQRGQLIFEDTPLRDAAAEFNRYGATKLVIDSPDAGNIPVGGVFRIGDFMSFAHAVAASHDLRVVRREGEVILTHSSADSAR